MPEMIKLIDKDSINNDNKLFIQQRGKMCDLRISFGCGPTMSEINFIKIIQCRHDSQG